MSADHAVRYWCEIESPIGPLLLQGTPEALSQLNFQAGPRPVRPDPSWRRDAGVFRDAATQLGEYFAGERREFQLQLSPAGTAFQLSVWQALQLIPYGRTSSYGELARGLGNANGSRAVGLANGSNPIAIIIPCHRVIGADGSLTGFGGGLPIKHALLSLERADCVTDLFSLRA
jgi:methylated-DNA-[protein]-cysteine S-methyltransferase